jgi:hypothetical protein
MRVPTNQWVHIAVDWAWHEASSGHVITVYIDGVLVQSETFHGAGRVPAFPARDVAFTLGESFHGVISDFHVSPSGQIPPGAIKEGVQCPFHYPNSLGLTVVADALRGAVRLGEGAGNTAKAGAVTGTAGHWVAIGEDSAGTVGSMVTVEGTGLTQAMSGEPGRFVITSRTGCGQKRRLGGDTYVVTIDATGSTAATAAAAAATLVNVRDAGDGSYFVSYAATHGTYRLTVTLAGTGVVATSNLAVAHSPADPRMTRVVGGTGAPALGCAGVVTRFQIAALNQFGAPAEGDDAEFLVTLTGPGGDITARVTPVAGPGAIHDVAIVPEVPGRYLVDMRMKSPMTGGQYVAFGGGDAPGTPTRYHCADVCIGHALTFPGTTTAYIAFDSPASAAAAGTNLSAVGGARAGAALTLSPNAGITLEAWVKLDAQPTTTTHAQLLKKGLPESVLKTFALEVTPVVVRATVYVGLGDTRIVSVPSPVVGTWTHYAAVYAADGSSFTMYVDGAAARTETFAGESRPAVANVNGEPLTLGGNLAGSTLDTRSYTLHPKP